MTSKVQGASAEIKRPGVCSKEEISAFCSAVRNGGEVSSKGLDERVRRAQALVFLYVDGTIVGVAALKQPGVAYRNDVFRKAEVPRIAGQFSLELGWVYVFPKHRGKGYSEVLSSAAVAQSGGAPVFATTRVDNTPMQKTLERVDFERVGHSYRSTRGDYRLQLYVRLDR